MRQPGQRAMEHLLRSLGMRRPLAAPERAEGRRTDVTRWMFRHERLMIGELTSEDGKFVFG